MNEFSLKIQSRFVLSYINHPITKSSISAKIIDKIQLLIWKSKGARTFQSSVDKKHQQIFMIMFDIRVCFHPNMILIRKIQLCRLTWINLNALHRKKFLRNFCFLRMWDFRSLLCNTQPVFTCSKSTRTICVKSVQCKYITIMAPEWCHWRNSGIFIVNF